LTVGVVYIPKEIREALGIRRGNAFKIALEDGKIILVTMEDIADEYYGVAEIRRWPKDLDVFIIEAIQEW